MTDELTDKPEEATQEQAPEAPEIQGVLVIKETTPDGSLSTDVRTLGNVQVTEVQTLMEIGLRGWRDKLGLKN